MNSCSFYPTDLMIILRGQCLDTLTEITSTIVRATTSRDLVCGDSPFGQSKKDCRDGLYEKQ